MTAQRLDRVVTCYRIGDPAGRFPIFDDIGSTLYPGRWNTASSPMVYTSQYYSTALLEKLAHSSVLPPNQHFIEITVPDGLTYEVVNEAGLAGWDNATPSLSKAYGERWQQAARSLILLVPSVVARVDKNILINRRHPEAVRVTWSLHQPVWWDSRLFAAIP